MTTILLADDHHIVRHSLRTFLDNEPEFSVIGDTGDSFEVADMAEELKPDVLVLDLRMPGLSGLEIARQVTRRSPSTRIVVLSMYDDSYLMEALKIGVLGYVLKEADAEELIQAIRDASSNRRYLSRSLTTKVIDDYVERAANTMEDPYDSLTDREKEVLMLVAQSYTNTEIANRLMIGSRTVETHRTHAMRKLQISNQTDLIRYAIRKGILPLEK